LLELIAEMPGPGVLPEILALGRLAGSMKALELDAEVLQLEPTELNHAYPRRVPDGAVVSQHFELQPESEMRDWTL